jgi:5'-deoxynucleotidase YfbR-like HD superfamily hydrolase
MKEYAKRESLESIVAKDADKLDQLLLCKEYMAQGVCVDKFRFKTKEDGINRCVTPSAQKLASEIYDEEPHRWWYELDND